MIRHFGIQHPNVIASKLVNLLRIREDPSYNLIVVFRSRPDKIPDGYRNRAPQSACCFQHFILALYTPYGVMF
jgi:hypothetical protein